MREKIWQFQATKSKFISHLVDNAMCRKPKIFTKYDNKTAVVIAVGDYLKFIKSKDKLVSFLRSSPLTELDLDSIRYKDMPRNLTS